MCAAAAATRVPAAGRDEAPRVDAGADGGRAGTGDDTDFQAVGFGAPEGRVGVERRLVVRVLRVLAHGQVQDWTEQKESTLNTGTISERG